MPYKRVNQISFFIATHFQAEGLLMFLVLSCSSEDKKEKWRIINLGKNSLCV